MQRQVLWNKTIRGRRVRETVPWPLSLWSLSRNLDWHIRWPKILQTPKRSWTIHSPHSKGIITSRYAKNIDGIHAGSYGHLLDHLAHRAADAFSVRSLSLPQTLSSPVSDGLAMVAEELATHPRMSLISQPFRCAHWRTLVSFQSFYCNATVLKRSLHCI